MIFHWFLFSFILCRKVDAILWVFGSCACITWPQKCAKRKMGKTKKFMEETLEEPDFTGRRTAQQLSFPTDGEAVMRGINKLSCGK